MPENVKTMKLHLHATSEDDKLFCQLTERYASACNCISQYVFNNDFVLNFMELQKHLYQTIREAYELKAQMTISAFKTVTARYKAVKEQMGQSPYKYLDEHKKPHYIKRTLEWMQKPIVFHRPQADLVRGRDYAFVKDGLSLNTLEKRVVVAYDVPECFKDYFDGTWSFGTGKLVNLNGEWYFHIPMTKSIPDTFDASKPKHVVGIDRGLRFLATTYDETGHTEFYSGADILKKRDTFNAVRAQLQSKGTKSAKRALKRISGRENRWMTDVNHQLSKTLVEKYGADTLFVIEDLTGVSFADSNLKNRTAKGRNELHSWAFYQLEQFLMYKASAAGSAVIKVPADYTSQRCPKCGRILKENRHHDTHEYICDCCGYRSNDDRVGAMNIYQLGTMYVSGDTNPRYGSRRTD